MYITKLDIVNQCLGSMGESPVNSLDYNNPFISSADLSFKGALAREQAPGWYFNTETIEVRPTIDQEYYVSVDVLGLVRRHNPAWLSLRGRRLYDNGAGTFLRGTSPLRCRITRLVEFDQLPFHMQSLIQWATVLDFQTAYDADESKVRQAQENYARAYTQLMAEHTRAVSTNGLSYGSVGHTRHNIRRPLGRNNR